MHFLRNKEHNTPANKTTNRDYLVNHLRATDMKVANTYYQKPYKLKGTYQRKDNVNGGPPWNTDRYCELDHCMVKKQWMNTITNIQADPYTNIKHRSQSTGSRNQTETESTHAAQQGTNTQGNQTRKGWEDERRSHRGI